MGMGHVKDVLESEVDWPSPTAKYAAIWLAYHADRRGIIRASQVELATGMLVNPKTVSRVVDDLCDSGFLVRLGHGRYGLRNEYAASDTPHPLPPAKKGLDKEIARLQAILDEEGEAGNRVHRVAWSDGWPVLVPFDQL